MVGVLTQVSCQLLFGLDVVKLVNSRYNYTSAGYCYPLCLLSIKSPAFSLADSPALCLVPSSSFFSPVRRSWSTPTCRASSSLLCRLLNPRHSHIHPLSHLSIAAQRALSRIVSKLKQSICNLCHSYKKYFQKPMPNTASFRERFVCLFHRVSTLITTVSVL